MVRIEVAHEWPEPSATLAGALLADEHIAFHVHRVVQEPPEVRTLLVPMLAVVSLSVLDDLPATETTIASRTVPTHRPRWLAMVLFASFPGSSHANIYKS